MIVVTDDRKGKNHRHRGQAKPLFLKEFIKPARPLLSEQDNKQIGVDNKMNEINKVCVIEKVFDAKKTIYSDDEQHIEGYDGEHSNNILFFDKESEADKYIEEASVSCGENAESGSTWELLFKGFINKIDKKGVKI